MEKELKRRIWTEDDILNIPFEHDKYETKGGRMFGKGADWRETLAKAVCAFANTYGGYIAVGVEDEKVADKKTGKRKFDGVDAKKGQEPFADWLAKQIPDLLYPPLQNYRVLPVIASKDNSQIPFGKILVVVEVGDSNLAPHLTTDARRCY